MCRRLCRRVLYVYNICNTEYTKLAIVLENASYFSFLILYLSRGLNTQHTAPSHFLSSGAASVLFSADNA